ncbi:MAG: isochorismatase family protein [Devosiaceae bacterium]
MLALMKPDRSQLLIVDVQERLLPAMQDQEDVVSACAFLAKAAGLCSVPTLITEQYPAGLGHTLQAVLDVCTKPQVVEKTAFSVAQDSKALDKLRKRRTDQRRDQIIICGVEAHVCVLQSALDLKGLGFDVFAVADAVSSRHLGSRDVALSRMAHAGIVPVTTEMVAFEWLGDAKAKAFKPISALVRER